MATVSQNTTHWHTRKINNNSFDRKSHSREWMECEWGMKMSEAERKRKTEIMFIVSFLSSASDSGPDLTQRGRYRNKKKSNQIVFLFIHTPHTHRKPSKRNQRRRLLYCTSPSMPHNFVKRRCETRRARKNCFILLLVAPVQRIMCAFITTITTKFASVLCGGWHTLRWCPFLAFACDQFYVLWYRWGHFTIDTFAMRRSNFSTDSILFHRDFFLFLCSSRFGLLSGAVSVYVLDISAENRSRCLMLRNF